MVGEVHIDAGGMVEPESVIRTAISLALLTTRPIIVENFLTNCDRRGLQRRHLTMLELATAVSRGFCEGAELGKSSFGFYPRALHPGKYTFSVGTAGSAVDVIGGVVLPLCFAAQPSQITVFGATHQVEGVSFDYYNRVVMPLYRAGGLDVGLTLHQAGFAPRGVGKVSLNTGGGQLVRRYHLAERGELRAKRVIAMVRAASFEASDALRTALQAVTGCEGQALTLSAWPDGPDALDTVVVEVESEFVVQAFTGYVTNGHSLSEVAEEVTREADLYLAAGAPVMADAASTLLPIMCAAGGGTFVASDLNETARSVIGLCKEFYNVKIKLTQTDAGGVEVTVRER